MKVELSLVTLAIPVVAGIVGTRIWARRRERGTIAQRLAKWTATLSAEQRQPPSLLKERRPDAVEPAKQFLVHLFGVDMLADAIKGLLLAAGQEDGLVPLLTLSLFLLLSPVLIAFAIGLNPLYALLVGLALGAAPLIFLVIKAESRRTKFCEQLPDAIDLMVAVLRSGHSVSQAVKAIAEEMPDPCGEEYEAVLHRMNLGQPLSVALVVSSRRFRSYELDLIRRAVAIQQDIGGSLAELLDKTNYTLRERLKLVKQLKVITSQSRLSAIIVGALPVVLAVVLSFLSPGYLNLLFDDPLGKMLLTTSVVLELLGIVVMNRMSTMRL